MTNYLLNVVYEASGATTDERVLRPAHTTPNAGNTKGIEWIFGPR